MTLKPLAMLNVQRDCETPLKPGSSLPLSSGKNVSPGKIPPEESPAKSEHTEATNTSSSSLSDSSSIIDEYDRDHCNGAFLVSKPTVAMDKEKEVIEISIDTSCDSNSSKQDQTADEPRLCSCSSSLFSGREEHVEFFLPKLGMACNCNKISDDSQHSQPENEDPATLKNILRPWQLDFLATLDIHNVDQLICANKNGQECHHCESPRHQDPTSLKNILRPWQVDFLASMNIHKADQLLRAYKKNPRGMARAMKQWRIDQEMQAVRSKSCYIALHIWCRTSKVVLKSVKGLRKPQQKKDVYNDSINSVAHQPDFLEISFSSEYSVSTLGIASIADGAVLGETMEI